jgi:hypothetical protein
MKTGWSISALTGAVAIGMIMLPALAPGDSDNQEKEIKPNGKGIGTLFNPGNGNGNANGQAKGKPGGGGTSGNGISYHGGPVMTGNVKVYYIWYGNWINNTARAILTDLASTIGGSPYMGINTTYYDGTNTHVSGLVEYAGSTDDNYSLGSSLTDANIATIVSTAITSGKLPKDANGAYFVLASADVAERSGFCSQYCGWHTYGTLPGTTIKYAFVGNADRCPTACAAQAVGPNGNAGADAMASVISHELEEMISDPQLNAWYDNSGAENADKCAWTFGTTYAANGALANMKLGARDFLIQRNWLNANGGACALSFP